MGSKAPPRNWAAVAAGEAGKAGDQSPAQSGSRAYALLQQVAGALQVPVSVLFNPPNLHEALVERSDGTAPDTTGLSAECAALIRAYISIRDPAERRRLLKLLQESAERA